VRFHYGTADSQTPCPCRAVWCIERFKKPIRVLRGLKPPPRSRRVISTAGLPSSSLRCPQIVMIRLSCSSALIASTPFITKFRNTCRISTRFPNTLGKSSATSVRTIIRRSISSRRASARTSAITSSSCNETFSAIARTRAMVALVRLTALTMSDRHGWLPMGELAASIAHEVNQPLGAIANNGNACLRLLASGVISSKQMSRNP
jgi:hypothetical protein